MQGILPVIQFRILGGNKYHRDKGEINLLNLKLSTVVGGADLGDRLT
jgi:hypothetical protein